MALTDRQLDEVVAAWRAYAEGSPQRIVPSELLQGRDLNMYRGLGISDASELARRLVDDRSAASLEMTMGYLHERVLEELGPRKVSNAERRTPAFRGIDFIQTLPGQVRLINLKSGLSTSNSDISQATITNLTGAANYWRSHSQPDDNPLLQRVREVVMVRAVARGPRRRTTTPEGIVWLVGESMWEFFDAGDRLLERLGEALSRSPLDYAHYRKEKESASARVIAYLRRAGLVSASDEVDWRGVISRFP